MKTLSKKMLESLELVHRKSGTARAGGWTSPGDGYDLTSQTVEALEARALVTRYPHPAGGWRVTITVTGHDVLVRNGLVKTTLRRRLKKQRTS